MSSCFITQICTSFYPLNLVLFIQIVFELQQVSECNELLPHNWPITYFQWVEWMLWPVAEFLIVQLKAYH